MGKDKHSGGRLLLATLLFIFGGTAFAQDRKITDTDLCSLIKHPERFNKKRVRVNARVESAVVEGGTWLDRETGRFLCVRRTRGRQNPTRDGRL